MRVINDANTLAGQKHTLDKHIYLMHKNKNQDMPDHKHRTGQLQRQPIGHILN